MHENFSKYMKEKSVHLEKWPVADKKAISAEHEEAGAAMNTAISLIRKEKSRKNISLNSPVKKAIITMPKGRTGALRKTANEIAKTMKVEGIEILEGEEEKAEIVQ